VDKRKLLLFNDTWKVLVVSAQRLDGVHKKDEKRLNGEFMKKEHREHKRRKAQR
jgi:hypothetical protein